MDAILPTTHRKQSLYSSPPEKELQIKRPFLHSSLSLAAARRLVSFDGGSVQRRRQKQQHSAGRAALLSSSGSCMDAILR